MRLRISFAWFIQSRSNAVSFIRHPELVSGSLEGVINALPNKEVKGSAGLAFADTL
ncbi:hypothetical protein [Bowmanella dokdonensis]|uniref:Uncharacterized protein n=1 Tax=Bowmanella dokdonensis TaxID=751969 RepID=A0A939DR89_9ALTE|nr:hypothetical protein [Bowmanella dokdonensis]MBN7827198.1 hypothetical protein [Bowmanella dokdonensis]